MIAVNTPSKVIFTLMVEQCMVLVILLAHLKGFMNTTPLPARQALFNSDFENSIQNSSHYTTEKLSHKIVLMIIDALRTDHLMAEKRTMPYTQELIEQKKGIGYLMKTASPTVTLPRIKSIVTGTIPSFMDVVYNFAAAELLDESIIHLAQEKGMKINFYGDELWLKIFPNVFHHWDKVTSFFVSDYTEVDNNITRHIPDLFSTNFDWDFLILHYLGLDHIGHLEGPQSSLIEPKLTEMDNIIKDIHQNLVKKGKPFLLLVCGDHGMHDTGGHGGDSHSEIWTSALAVSHLTTAQESHSYRSPVEKIRHQVDLASTLALHMGLPIPIGSIGVPLPETLEKLPIDHQLSAHYRVTRQLAHLAAEILGESEFRARFSAALTLAHEHHLSSWRSELNPQPERRTNATEALRLYKEVGGALSSALADHVQFYDFPLLLASSVVLILVSLPTIIWSLFVSGQSCSSLWQWMALVVVAGGTLVTQLLRWGGVTSISPTTVAVVVLLFYGVANLFSFAKCFTHKFEFKISVSSILQVATLTGVILHPFSLLATSFVEEEHYGHYFSISVVYFLVIDTLIRRRLRLVTQEDAGGSIPDDDWLNAKLNNADTPHLPPHRLTPYPPLFDADSSILRVLKGRGGGHKRAVLYATSPGVSHPLIYTSRFILMFLCWALFRLLRAFNATGDKWRTVTHLNDLLKNADETALLVSIVIGLCIAVFLFQRHAPVFVLLTAVATLGRFFPVLEKGALESQFAYLSLFSLLLYCLVKLLWYKRCHPHAEYDPMNQKSAVLYLLLVSESFFGLLFILLQKPENVLVTSLCFLHSYLFIAALIRNDLFFGLPRTYVYVIAYWVAQSHFFIQGNSNSLATVNINAGFIGVPTYLPWIHGTLIVIHTFGAKFMVLLHTVIVVLCHDYNLMRIGECLRCWWMLQLLDLTVYVLNVTIQRHHLFIWSVFAPKLLYEEAHFLSLMLLSVLIAIFFRVGKGFAV